MGRDHGSFEDLERALGLGQPVADEELILGDERGQWRDPVEDRPEDVRQVAALVFGKVEVGRAELVRERLAPGRGQSWQVRGGHPLECRGEGRARIVVHRAQRTPPRTGQQKTRGACRGSSCGFSGN